MACNFGYCRDCRHWGRVYPSACDRVGWDSHYERSNSGNKFGIAATADDDQGLEARLVTGPDFGCVRFESNGKGGTTFVVTAVGPFDDPDRL